jgi:hypothetical protein
MRVCGVCGAAEFGNSLQCEKCGAVAFVEADRAIAYNSGGFGTMLLGQQDFRRDGSYLTTKFVVLMCFPVFPTKTLRVKDLAFRHWHSGRQGHMQTTSVVLDEGFPNVGQVSRVFFFAFSLIFAIAGCFVLSVRSHFPRRLAADWHSWSALSGSESERSCVRTLGPLLSRNEGRSRAATDRTSFGIDGWNRAFGGPERRLHLNRDEL